MLLPLYLTRIIGFKRRRCIKQIKKNKRRYVKDAESWYDNNNQQSKENDIQTHVVLINSLRLVDYDILICRRKTNRFD
jgi:hypothetical protein